MTSFFFWATVASLLFGPDLKMLSGLPSLRADDVLPFLWLTLAFAGGGYIHLNAPNRYRLACLVAFVCLLPISIASGNILGLDASMADLIQLARFLKYMTIYILACAFFRDAVRGRSLGRIALLSIPLLALSLVQYFDIGDLNTLYIPTIAPTQFETLIPGYPTPRPVGMVGNPNELGFMFAILGLAALHLMLRNRSKMQAVALLCSIAGALMTLSRGAAVGLAAGICVAVLAHMMLNARKRERRVLMAGGAIVCIALVAVLFWPPVYDEITWRFARLADIETDISWTARIDNWSENWRLFQMNPVIGVGPLRRATLEHAADNDWLLIARSYGTVGVVVFIAFLFAPMRRISAPLILSLAAAGALYMVPLSLFHSLVLFPLFLVMLAAADSEYPIKRRSSQSW